mmetsp:Transcript_58514/g.67578  ORF Transcript_58514/g.67578 Transcript_58514/m.67578 type:complete len:150 (+) Transcript_58514:49-498(+)
MDIISDLLDYNSDSLQNMVRPQTSADFCLQCGELLGLPKYSDYFECNKCGFKISILEYKMDEIITEKVFTKKKPWLEKYNDKNTKGKKGKQVENTTASAGPSRAVIDMPCKKCDSKKLYYYTMQTRSADEGQTVFYECVKCGHTEVENS